MHLACPHGACACVPCVPDGACILLVPYQGGGHKQDACAIPGAIPGRGSQARCLRHPRAGVTSKMLAPSQGGGSQARCLRHPVTEWDACVIIHITETNQSNHTGLGEFNFSGPCIQLCPNTKRYGEIVRIVPDIYSGYRRNAEWFNMLPDNCFNGKTG